MLCCSLKAGKLSVVGSMFLGWIILNFAAVHAQTIRGSSQRRTAEEEARISLKAAKTLNGVTRKQVQASHHTKYDRYAREFSITAEYYKEVNVTTPKKILSFGCSEGLEAITLAQKYFPSNDVKIVGVDIDDETLDKARKNAIDYGVPEGRTIFFNGRKEPLKEYGPFDIIYANAVLEKHPAPKKVSHLTNFFPFHKFEQYLEILDKSLNVGGLLAMVNTNYNFEDSEKLFKRYRPLNKMCTNNAAPRVDLKTMEYVHIYGKAVPCVFVKVESDQ